MRRKQNQKSMSTVRPIMTYTLETRVETSKATQMLEANEMKILRKIVKTKIERIRSQQIGESCGVQPINEWVERIRRRE